jgi:hypothetical protein
MASGLLRRVSAGSSAAWLLSISVATLLGCDAGERSPRDDRAGSCAAPQPGPAPLRLLTREQYNNTVRDLLGDASRPADAFPPVATVEGFENNAELHRANPLLVGYYLSAAELVAASAVDRGLERFLPCSWDTPDARACGRDFIERFGKAAFRRPLEADEQAVFERLFDRTLPAQGFRSAIRWVIEAVLQSPQFLSPVDSFKAPTTETGAVHIGGWEMASRLSYFLWNSMPDETLFAAAERGELARKREVEAQARRMLEDERARGVVRDFHRQWLGLDRFSGVVRNPTDNSGIEKRLPAAWRASLEAFVDQVYWSGSGDLESLFTSPTVFVDADLATLYGVSPPGSSGLSAVDLDARERAGLLTQPGLVALLSHPDQSSPIRRGVFVRERIMCEPLPPPPPDVDTTPPEVDPALTTRARFAKHTASAGCAICHERIDGIGFGLENYDAFGRFRTVEGQGSLDVSGAIVDARDEALDGPFNGPIELAQRLATSRQVLDCVATQWFRYAMGRIEGEDDACSLAQAQSAFAWSNGSFKELLVALTQTDAFLYRAPPEPKP